MKRLSGWGRYPICESIVKTPRTYNAILDSITSTQSESLIARGMGRSYGDSSLSSHIVSAKNLNQLLSFDRDNGILVCSSGATIEDILEVCVPLGWFPSVTPGTKFVSIGGCIASDVHGKNHHSEGCFSDYVSSLKIATVSHGIITCSRSQHSDLFYATCGGMGLTGIILEATLKLKPIKSSFIRETTIKARNLEELLNLMSNYNSFTYSVAWIDCLSTGDSFGRSLLMLGEHTNFGGLSVHTNGNLSIPFDFPNFALNSLSIKLFNSMYYHKVLKSKKENLRHYDTFFYPLDSIENWNKIYGKNGFVQYQFVIPRENGLKGMSLLLKEITLSKKGSFLAVIKAFGKSNNNLLSFPMEGYTLALDFKIDKDIFVLLERLDKIVLEYGGRIYLTKDARMSESTFKSSYHKYGIFRKVREKYKAFDKFKSMQSIRLNM